MNNDLISREALKKAIEPYKYATDGVFEGISLIIDNAPTVEVYTKDDIAGAYNEGYMCGSREAEKARPQGEWAEFEGGYRCSNCDDIEAYTPNFCPNCGAKMKGGAEE